MTFIDIYIYNRTNVVLRDLAIHFQDQAISPLKHFPLQKYANSECSRLAHDHCRGVALVSLTPDASFSPAARERHLPCSVEDDVRCKCLFPVQHACAVEVMQTRLRIVSYSRLNTRANSMTQEATP